MNDSFGGFTQQAGDANQDKKAEGTLPVFLKQLHLQKEDVVKMWGFEYKMITTVAVVRNIEHASTKITYLLEDRTGKISAHLWVEEGENPTASSIMLNTYVRVIGAVRHQGETKSIMIYKIRPVKGINEVNTHMIEVINARYQSEEYCRGGSGASNDNVKMEVGNAFTDKIASSQQSQNGPTEGKSIAIFKVIQASLITNPERGTSRQELHNKFPHISDHEIANILDKMSGDGLIYSTVDSDHFLACY